MQENTTNAYGTVDGRPDTLAAAPRPYQGEQAMNQPTTLRVENLMRPLAIRQLNHGYIIEVGCQAFAIESASNLIAKLAEYIADPTATEMKWRDGKLF